VPQLGAPQQTPLTQLPLVHWLPPVHAVPLPFLATQLPGVVVLPLQYRLVLEQCVSAVQLVRHEVPLQT